MIGGYRLLAAGLFVLVLLMLGAMVVDLFDPTMTRSDRLAAAALAACAVLIGCGLVVGVLAS